MDLMKTEYEFLDLSDVKEAELSSLQCALFEGRSQRSNANWSETTIDLSSCSSSTAGGPPTVSSSLDSLSGGECDMAPHSPQRAGGGQGGAGPPPPPPYAQPPPPPYGQPPPPPPHGPPPQWPVAPPNVYVSQVTANVNVHGYMGQYYQPPHSQFAQPPAADRAPRPHRRERRPKRTNSPPAVHAPPYYVQYPPYYTPAQAQGSPLYHMPMYQPVTYVGHYPYHPYYPEYQVPVEGEVDKGPEEYPQEVMMEQEAVDAYYAGAHYGGPPYAPPVEGPMEFMPPIYMPPPTHPAALQALQAPPQPYLQNAPHQFNVHAKNFVQNQNHNKSYVPQDRHQERPKTPPAPAPSATVTTCSVEALPVKDLKISNRDPPTSKVNERSAEPSQPKQVVPQTEKVPPTPKAEAPKPVWLPSESKPAEATVNPLPQVVPVKSFTTSGPSASQAVIAAKHVPTPGKITKGPAAPFSGNKQPPKPSLPTAAVPVQQTVSIPKAPFGNRQKREGANARSPSGESSENAERPAPAIDHSKREPPLPPSKAPMPISITLHSQGPPSIVTNKSPFGHSRKSTVPAEPPAPLPPPPAPTASDFPPPPTPRNRGEPAPMPTPVLHQPQPAPGKSWASLFSNKIISADDPPTPPPKPVAKVPPYDATPQQQTVADKSSPTPKHATSTLSYSEKTSVNAVSHTPSVTPAAAPPPAPASAPASAPPASAPAKSSSPTAPEQRDLPAPALPLPPSPFADDPNSYRMGEFLTKYHLDSRPVSLLPRGLTNRSNYCYVNAILQALIACPPFYNMLKALPYQTRRGKSSTPVIDAMVELCYEFTPLPPNSRVSRARSADTAGAAAAAGSGLPVQTGAPLDPAAGQKVLRALRPFPGSQEGRQEDAEEFLGCLLNGLNDEMLELMKLVAPEETKDMNQTNGIIIPEPPLDEDDDDDEWKVMGPKNKGAIERRWLAGRTPLADIFRGRTRCRTHRAPHHDVTDAVQPFFTLQLDIERANSVKDALELLAGKDALEGVAGSDAWQQLSIEQLPVVLLLHLKCFQLDAEGHTAKIVKNIEFPIDLKIDTKVMSSKLKYTNKQRLYKLFAVVYHEGVEAVKGHYVTDTYHGQAGWIRYDDSTVTLVNDGQVLKPKPPRMPYLLMYRRHDTLPAPHRPVPNKD